MTNLCSKIILLIITTLMMHPQIALAKHRRSNVTIAIESGNIGHGHRSHWTHVGHRYHKRYRRHRHLNFDFRYVRRPRPNFWNEGYYAYPTRRYRVVQPPYYYQKVPKRYIRPQRRHHRAKQRAGLRLWSPAWYDYCRAKYRSFNAKTGYYTTYSGRKRFCR